METPSTSPPLTPPLTPPLAPSLTPLSIVHYGAIALLLVVTVYLPGIHYPYLSMWWSWWMRVLLAFTILTLCVKQYFLAGLLVAILYVQLSSMSMVSHFPRSVPQQPPQQQPPQQQPEPQLQPPPPGA